MAVVGIYLFCRRNCKSRRQRQQASHMEATPLLSCTEEDYESSRAILTRLIESTE